LLAGSARGDPSAMVAARPTGASVSVGHVGRVRSSARRSRYFAMLAANQNSYSPPLGIPRYSPVNVDAYPSDTVRRAPSPSLAEVHIYSPTAAEKQPYPLPTGSVAVDATDGERAAVPSPSLQYVMSCLFALSMKISAVKLTH